GRGGVGGARGGQPLGAGGAIVVDDERRDLGRLGGPLRAAERQPEEQRERGREGERQDDRAAVVEVDVDVLADERAEYRHCCTAPSRRRGAPGVTSGDPPPLRAPPPP